MSISIILLFVILFSLNINADNGGGFDCAACTIAVSLVEQLSEVHNQTIDEVISGVCKYFPSEFTTICQYFVTVYGPTIIDLFDQEFTSDEICHSIAFCTDSTCKLWPASGKPTPKPIPKFVALRPLKEREGATPWDWILELLAPIIDKSEPVLDFDGDLFSTEETLRGTSWRGKDCDDFDSARYPGRKTTVYSPSVDHNCNGIYAINNIDYEKLYCDGTGQRGVIIVGDSAGAHFHIPPEYMNASAIDEDTFNDLLFVLSNEFDWPELSSSTGYLPSTPDTPVNSIYLKLRERNLCNHRDYQNIAKNGLRSGPSVEMAQTLSRSKAADQPVVLTFELIGNDVCSGHPDFTHFTDPNEFKYSLLEVLGNFSMTLPNNSYVIFMGLAQGSILWDLMNNRTHPLGPTYTEVYDFLNCLQISPCWTWMNSNQTVRETGDAWAQKLSDIYSEVISSYSYPNFKMIYYPFPFKQIISIWEAQGGEAWQLIEPVDGFHPNQISNAILADWMWNDLQQNHPEIIGAVNPNNAKIQALFGDQGGY